MRSKKNENDALNNHVYLPVTLDIRIQITVDLIIVILINMHTLYM